MSSYLVLARKYRPATFDDVVGQESVTRVLRGAIEEERIGHAYLFAGPRGTGKTTIARILAKCLNCESGPTATPCGTCERCEAAENGSEVDVIELDAASHTGVDTIRELRDEAAYAPMRARRKVYIIDEVHMLSKAAFNALLKTLEEPPPHVVFLFATTEPHKVLDTVLSRCQVLRLSALPEERITQRLEQVFEWEGVEAEPGVAAELARSARGGMRDALSQADKLLALAGRRPTLEDLNSLSGETGAREVEELLSALEEGDRGRCFTSVADARGEDGELVVGLLEALRTALILVHCGEQAPFVSGTEEERRSALGRAKRLGPERLELWMHELLRARERMRMLPDQSELVLEACLLDLCNPATSVPLETLVERLAALEGGSLPVSPQPVRSAPAPEKEPERTLQPSTRPSAQPAPAPQPPPQRTAAAPARPTTKLGLWKAFLAELGSSHGALASLIDAHARAEALAGEDSDELTIALAGLSEKEQRLVADRRNQKACARVFASILGRSVTVHLAATAKAGAPTGNTGGGATSTAPGPSTTEPRRKSGKQKDAFTEEVADLFGGVIEELP